MLVSTILASGGVAASIQDTRPQGSIVGLPVAASSSKRQRFSKSPSSETKKNELGRVRRGPGAVNGKRGRDHSGPSGRSARAWPVGRTHLPALQPGLGLRARRIGAEGDGFGSGDGGSLAARVPRGRAARPQANWVARRPRQEHRTAPSTPYARTSTKPCSTPKGAATKPLGFLAPCEEGVRIVMGLERGWEAAARA